jgi:calcium-dependent protein kinase
LEKEAKKIFKSMAKAIAYCHSLHICHRDVKPDNFMFSRKNDINSIKLIDFGFSTFLPTPPKRLKTILGTVIKLYIRFIIFLHKFWIHHMTKLVIYGH